MALFSSPAFLLSLLCIYAGILGTCLAEIIALRSPQAQLDGRNLQNAQRRITDLATRAALQEPPLTQEHDRRYLPGGIDESLDLLDIVLVASVDGNLHALNRTSGDTLWSMSSPVSTYDSQGTPLAPLVRTKHPAPNHDSDDEDDAQEVYVIEPQSGDIYVMPTRDSPLQRLPLSMAQLVELSPYSISGENSMKVFVGKKETSLLLVELETGRIKATLNMNSECPWDPDPFEDLSKDEDEDVDLDELDGTKPPKAKMSSTEVFIGRTDYHISIHTRPLNPSISRPPVQNLSFSTYGPNNQDQAYQALYRRTVDDTYIQSLANGKIMSFRTSIAGADPDMAPNARPVWARAYQNPIVAVFDVVRTPSRAHPFVLLQPSLGLQDLLPNVDLATAAKQDSLPNLESAFIGMIEATGSLYVMSPDRYPLVVFGDTNFEDAYTDVSDRHRYRYIDPPPGLEGEFEVGRDFPPDVDSITRAMKRKKLKEMCRQGVKDNRCFVGVRRLESSRLSRLLDGAATVPYPPHYNPNAPHDVEAEDRNDSPVNGRGNTSTIRTRPGDIPQIDSGSGGVGVHALSTYVIGVLTLMMCVWLVKKNLVERRSSTPSADPVSAELQSSDISQTDSTASTHNKEDHTSPVASIHPILSVSHEPPTSQPSSVETESPISAPPSEDIPDVGASNMKKRKVSFGEVIKVQPSVSQDDEINDGGAEGEDSDNDAQGTLGKKKSVRRRRGKKKPKGITVNGSADDGSNTPAEVTPRLSESQDSDVNIVHVVSPSSIVVPPPPTPTPIVPSLIVSDTILGFGSHGTVVFKGSLQGRAVAVKRLLQDFVTLASREVTVLQESDDHPNVIRYYYQEAHANFLYIALELCPASLADIVERPDLHRDISIAFDPKRALRQITSGLRHLHALKIIHRDIKPQNILVSHAKKGVGEAAGHRMLISDFGLCKKLELDQTSFLPTAHGAMAAGTVGWRAPEILRGEVTIDFTNGDESQSSRGSTYGSDAGTPTGRATRLTKSVDVFALGCLFYYVLTNGGHPFGDRFERDVNIMKNQKCLDGLKRFGEEGSEAVDLITKMLSPEAYERPDTSTCLLHPYFWDPGKRLNFLQDASDRFEIMCRDPRDPMLIELERNAFSVVGNDWNARLDKWFIENLGKYRKYDGKSVQDLMRALRNKKHHYQDLPDNVKRQIGSMPEGFLSYFTRRFPRLFMHVHGVISASSLRHESMFRTYFELSD